MKKITIILATAAIVASCSDNDTFRDINNQENGNEAIYFDTYTQVLTRAENSGAAYSWALKNHHSDFKVYAYKNPNTSYDTQVFSGQVIDAKEDGTFAYHVNTEARYWDKNASTTYQFFAAAPATNGDWTFVTSSITDYATQNMGSWNTTSTLSGVNLRNATAPSTSAIEAPSFKGTGDIDKMIADKCSGNYQSFPVIGGSHTVQLHFIHILSKLNVKVKKDDVLSSKTVQLKSIKFYNLKNNGTFTEGAAEADGTAKMSRWSSQGKVQVSSQDIVYGYENNSGVTLGADPIYFIESLVVPQSVATQTVDYDGTITPAVLYADLADYNATNDPDIDQDAFDNLTGDALIKTPAIKVSGTSEPYFVISYTIDGELFTSYHNLATSFKTTEQSTLNFYEGFQNTLTINIKPEKIEFAADVAVWADSGVNPAAANVD